MTTTTTRNPLASALIALREELTEAYRAAMVAAADARRAGVTDPDHLELAALRGARSAAPLRTVAGAMAEFHRAERNLRAA